MSLYKKIESDIKSAMKARQQERLLALRNIKAALKHQAIELKKPSLEDSEVHKVLTKLAKQRRDSLETYEKAGRQDLAQKEAAELKIIQTYLPQPLSDSELEKIISDTIQELGAKGPQDMGPVMKALQSKTAGRAEGKIVSQKVRQALS